MEEKIIKNIREYIIDNDISIPKLAKAADIPYMRLWRILYNRQYSIRLCDYIALCKALHEPLDFFIPN